MRIKIVIKTDKLPVIYRHRVLSLFKEALKRADQDYKEYLYNGKITKPYSFNIPLPREKMAVKGKIQIDNNFIIEDTIYELKKSFLSLYLSALDYRFLISLFNGIK
ncbi:MAG TPA: CRISPR-associated endoribonuclease Cas6, partial [Persephonella sp.]|nr:CRISPR-associated endoribonuclease Cas6 [Persephonella sp.]